MLRTRVGLEKPSVDFVAADTAPSPENASNSLVLDRLGRFALNGFAVDPNNPDCEVCLDSTLQPVLYLKEVLTSTVYGYVDQDTGEFIRDKYMPAIPHKATGSYTGPGSELVIS